MSGKSLILSGRDDVPVYEGKMSDFILNRIKEQNGDNVLMVDQNTKNTFTARDFHSKSVFLALTLRQKGIKEGDVISIVSENNLNYFVPVLATFYLGATISPINPLYSIGELRHTFNLSRPKVVFASKTALSKVVQLRSEIGCIEEVIPLEGGGENGDVEDLDGILGQTRIKVDEFEVSDFSDDNVAVILPSSGTTGLPKGVMITYDSIRYHLLYMELKPYVYINPDEIAMGVAPFFHIFGLFVHLFTILAGVKAILIPKFQPEVYLATIEEHRVNKLFIVPQLAQFLAKSPFVDKFDLSSVNDVLCGSAPLSVKIFQNVEERLHVKLRQMYGLTETGMCTIDNPKRDGVKTGTVGVLIPKLKAKVRDVETGKSLGPNVQGEICVKGPTVTRGYIGNSAATEGAFDEEGYFCTGDVGYYDEDDYFYIVDRLKDLIKYKGFQVPPLELEAIILQHPSVADVAVIGIPDERAGEVPLAVVVKKPGDEVTEQELIDLVAGQVSVLKHLYGGVKFTETLPKTPSGKVIKKQLQDKYKKG